MSTNLLDSVVEYVNRQKSQGETEVFRETLVQVMWFNRGLINDPTNPVELTRQLMLEASKQVGGVYIYNKGRARIVF